MWSIKPLSKGRKGFTLMELLCVICIGSIVLGICFSMLSFSQKANAFSDQTDDVLYNGNFALEFMKYEIQNADKIISSDKIPNMSALYPENIGLIIMEYQPLNDSVLKYVYITYTIENNRLWRRSRRFDKEIELLGEALTGKNEILEYVESFGETSIDWNNGIFYLDLDMGESKFIESFKSTISLNCELDF